MDEYNWKHVSAGFKSEIEEDARGYGVARIVKAVINALLICVWVIGLLVLVWVATPQ